MDAHRARARRRAIDRVLPMMAFTPGGTAPGMDASPDPTRDGTMDDSHSSIWSSRWFALAWVSTVATVQSAYWVSSGSGTYSVLEPTRSLSRPSKPCWLTAVSPLIIWLMNSVVAPTR